MLDQTTEYLGANSLFPFSIDIHIMSSPGLIVLSETR
jgi:hypothetical protein